MKALYITLLLIATHFSALSLSTDTCNYISQNNIVGGLDCSMTSLAPYTADSYQWLNCDNSFELLIGQTTETYTGISSINIALVVTYLGCIDTSECQFVCSWGLEDLTSDDVELIKIIDTMGRKTKDKPNVLLIYVYSDGTIKKVFRVEE